MVVFFFSPRCFKYIMLLLIHKQSANKANDRLIGLPFYMNLCFFHFAFKILFFFFLAILVMICLSVGLIGFVLFLSLCASWIWVSISIFKFGKFSAIISSNIFSTPFLSLSCFWDPYNMFISMFDVVPRSIN